MSVTIQQVRELKIQFINVSQGLRVSNMADRTKHLKRIIYAGTSTMTRQQFFTYLRELHIILSTKEYCLFTFNCRHVSLMILNRLNCNDGQGNLLQCN